MSGAGSSSPPVSVRVLISGKSGPWPVGRGVEVIAPSDGADEFIHLEPSGALVHRVSPLRSYLLKTMPLTGKAGFALRAWERLWELETLWNRKVVEVQVEEGAIPGWCAPLFHRSPETAVAVRPLPKPEPVDAVDLIVCSYRRFDELKVSLESILREVTAHPQLNAKVTVVHQDADLPERMLAAAPAWQANPQLRWVYSNPPSLTRARNEGLAHTSAPFVIFVDDDVLLDDGFLQAYVDAARAHAEAIGVVGGVRSRQENQRRSQVRSVGQIRASGYVEASFESQYDELTLVPQTPMGANMGYRRAPMTALFGPRWFDESLTGTAFREESTLAIRIIRAGQFLVFAPKASLFHFESLQGGCENRTQMTPEQKLRRTSLEYAFLGHLYERSAVLGSVGKLATAFRTLRLENDLTFAGVALQARALLRASRR